MSEYVIRVSNAQIQEARRVVRHNQEAGYERSDAAVECVADAAGTGWRSGEPSSEPEAESPEFDGVHPYVDAVERNMPRWASFGEPPRYTSLEYVGLVRSLVDQANKPREQQRQYSSADEASYTAEGMTNIEGTPGEAGSSWDIVGDDGRPVTVKVVGGLPLPQGQSSRPLPQAPSPKQSWWDRR